MAGWEADRPGIVTQMGEAQGLSAVDQHAQNASPAREVADQPLALVVDADGDELFERRAARIDDAQRAVACAGQLDRRLDHLPKQ